MIFRFAGSDVSGIQTTATKTEDGKHWIVNGTKKWITNGTFADYFTVGCKTEVSASCRSFSPRFIEHDPTK
jgi:alkylation response protein AidB-like acyl-CoA dehydrogenase